MIETDNRTLDLCGSTRPDPDLWRSLTLSRLLEHSGSYRSSAFLSRSIEYSRTVARPKTLIFLIESTEHSRVVLLENASVKKIFPKRLRLRHVVGLLGPEIGPVGIPDLSLHSRLPGWILSQWVRKKERKNSAFSNIYLNSTKKTILINCD